MKILYINSVYQYGSTGRLVKDLMEASKAKGHDVLCVYGRHDQGDVADTFYIGSKWQTAVHVLMTRLFGRHALHSILATRKLIQKIKEFKPDVIHLHNLHGYYIHVPMLMKFLKKLDVKIIWTLHDTWSISGSAAYFDYYGCKEWYDGCVRCLNTKEYPEVWFIANQGRNFTWKKENFTGFKNMHIITVSNWLRGILIPSFLNQYPVTTIYNGIDLNTFTPKYKEAPKSTVKLLGVANIWEERKGLNDFIELSKRLPSQYEITLVGLSESQIQSLPHNIKGIQRTSSIEELVSLYQEADIYLNLSVEETMGLTTVEAMACGTPAIVYNRTAVPEMIDSASGVKVQARDMEQLVKAVMNFSFGTYTGEKARKRAEEFTMKKMLDSYLRQYQD